MSGAPRASAEPAAEPDRAWHALAARDVLERLNSSADGLPSQEAERRLEQHGPNALEVARPASVWSILVAQLKSVVVLLLFAAAVVALLMDDPLDAAAILAVLFINTLMGFLVELRARRAMEALLGLDVATATVVRDGHAHDVEARTLVPGDVILVEAGEAVPADARVLDAKELRVDEAPLTGESVPADKVADATFDEDTPIADRDNLLFKATTVVAGAARAVVVHTGMDTEVGRIGRLTGGIREEKTPLELKLDALGRRLVLLTLLIAAGVVGLGLLRGFDALAMVETGIALAIAAVPEGLPAVSTITLGLGLRRMARRNALIRRLPAVEALGAATIVCTDKTGTLTAGQMTATHLWLPENERGLVYHIEGTGYAPEGGFLRVDDGSGAAEQRVEPGDEPRLENALRIAALASLARVRQEDGAWVAAGDPTEAALVVAAAKAGLQRTELLRALPEIGLIPFSSERRWMATAHRDEDGRRVTCVKGDPLRIVELCTRMLTEQQPVELDDGARARLIEANERLAAEGLRVLALARREDQTGEDAPAQDGFDFVAFIGLIDPPVPGVDATIARFHHAGIRTVMITGDQRQTAEAVARDLGLLREGDATLDGRELHRLQGRALAERVPHVAAFSRVSPEDKLRIVEAFQQNGEIVAMLGDGVNDAAALKKADIGVAMGLRGTDVAKEAASVVLGDDRFESIGAAIEEGRVIFDNIRKFVYYLFSCNLAEVLVLMTATLAGLPLPLLPLQILWLNIVTDTFPALALALEPADPDVMDRPPRDPDAAILSRAFLIRIAIPAALITAVTLGSFLWGLFGAAVGTERAVTMAFMTLALAQIFHLGNARSRQTVMRPERALANRWALGAVAFTVALQLVAVYFAPLSAVLSTVALDARDWLVIVPLALTPAILGQLERWWGARRERGGQDGRDSHPSGRPDPVE